MPGCQAAVSLCACLRLPFSSTRRPRPPKRRLARVGAQGVPRAGRAAAAGRGGGALLRLPLQGLRGALVGSLAGALGRRAGAAAGAARPGGVRLQSSRFTSCADARLPLPRLPLPPQVRQLHGAGPVRRHGPASHRGAGAARGALACRASLGCGLGQAWPGLAWPGPLCCCIGRALAAAALAPVWPWAHGPRIPSHSRTHSHSHTHTHTTTTTTTNTHTHTHTKHHTPPCSTSWRPSRRRTAGWTRWASWCSACRPPSQRSRTRTRVCSRWGRRCPRPAGGRRCLAAGPATAAALWRALPGHLPTDRVLSY
jgi:hypothetical protein